MATQPKIDRRKLTRLHNQDAVRTVFLKEGRPLTITEVLEGLRADGHYLVDKTVRNLVSQLVETGILRENPMRGNAKTYALTGTASSIVNDSQPMVTVGRTTLTLKDFLEMMMNELVEPLSVDGENAPLNDEWNLQARQMMVATIITASVPQRTESVLEWRQIMSDVVDTIRHVAGLLDGFVNSPVWNAEYRDALAFELRRVEESNPELIQLARDFIK